MHVSPPSTSTVRLTDQALVAVHLARGLAAGRTASVAHLVVGLLGEPDGRAGRQARRLAGGEPAVRLSQHPGLHAPGLPSLANTLIALPVTEVPAWTDDLLRAAVRVGGQDLADLLADAGLDTPIALVLEEGIGHTDPDPDDPGETFGRGAFAIRGFDALADEVVSRARARSTTTEALLPLLQLAAEDRTALANLPVVDIKRVVDRALTLPGPGTSLKDLTTALLSVALEDLKLRG